MESRDPEQPKRHRFLVAIHGVLHVDAADGAEANRKAGEWIVAAAEGHPLNDAAINVGWLQITPFDEENVGWPPRPEPPETGKWRQPEGEDSRNTAG